MAEFHPHITEQLLFFLKNDKIPNIIFYGPNGSGKRTIVHNFLTAIYRNNKPVMKTCILHVNCAHGKGIKFVREELKFFAKTHINMEGSDPFKTVVLSNADNLTPDAQSAMRRCIELFSHSTRFFLIVENKNKLLKPILSRLCEIYVQVPRLKGNLYQQKLLQTFAFAPAQRKTQQDILRAKLSQPPLTAIQIMDCALQLYEEGFSGLDLLQYIEHDLPEDPLPKFQRLITFQHLKKEFRNERLFMAFMLYFMFIRSDQPLENISFM